MIKVSTSRYCN